MSSFLAKMRQPRGSKAAKGQNINGPINTTTSERPRHMRVQATTYTSIPVKLAPAFLKATPYDAKPIITYPVDFTKTPLPEYDGMYAIVLDNVLSASECKQLIAYAEESAGAKRPDATGHMDTNNMEMDNANLNGDGKIEAEQVENNGWKPALVNAGQGREVLVPEYRNSDRIIWDDQEVMDRLWARCLQGEGIKEQLGRIEDKPLMQGKAAGRGEKWHVTRLNERMRFLKYGPGQFFQGHCDGTYQTPGSDPEERSFVTLHLYLNDSLQAITPVDNETASPLAASFPPPLANSNSSTSEEVTLRGGATAFHSGDAERRLDVHPKMGRVLLFQHSGLVHSGDYVTAGVKYTMRTDLMYELEPMRK